MIVDHVHRGYKWSRRVDGGRDCDECHRILRRQDKAYDLRKSRGEVSTVVRDYRRIDQFRRNVRILEKRGFSRAEIARNIGISRWRMGELTKPGTLPSGMKASTLEAFERFFKDSKNHRQKWRPGQVDGSLARAAIQGLMLRGYTTVWLSEQLGCNQQRVSEILRGTGNVSVEHDAALTALARKYGTTDGPSSRTRALAERRGYKSTVEYDEFL